MTGKKVHARLRSVTLAILLAGVVAACGPNVPPPPTRGPLPTLESGRRLDSDMAISVANAPRIASLGNLIGHEATVNQLTFAPDARWLATRDAEGKALVWDLWTVSPPRNVGSDVLYIFFADAGETLVTVSAPSLVRFYGADDGQMQGSAAGNREQIVVAAASADGLHVATGGLHGDILYWDLRRREPQWRTSGEMVGIVTALAISPDGARLASLTQAPSGMLLVVWDAASGSPLATQTFTGNPQPLNVAFSPDSALLAATFGSDVRMLNVTDLSVRLTLTAPERLNTRVMAFSPDGRFFASTGVGDAAYVWTLADEQLAATLPGAQNAEMTLAFSPDSSLLLTTSVQPGAGALLWQTAAFVPGATSFPNGPVAPQQGNGLLTAAWSPDSRYIALAEASGAVMLWGIPLP